jgi:hypothetical protein
MSNNLKSNLTLLGLLLLATLFTAYNMGSAELQPWDEARRGINALRMLQGGDYFNYHFLDQTDSFNTKPNGGEFTLARKECDNAMMRYCIIPPK